MFVIAGTLLVAGTPEAHADRIHTLARTLVHSKHDKARISAAVSLGRLNDPRTLKPLVRALKDRNQVVRAVAATALGNLGNADALPSLQRATRDSNKLVRKRAVESIAAIRNRSIKKRTARRPRAKRAGFGTRPRRLGPEPKLFLAVKSATDDSPGRAKKRERKQRAAKMRRLMVAALRSQADVTLNAGEARTFGIEKSSIDVSITKLSRRVRGKYIEIECEIRIAISNERGKMLSFLTGGAKVQVPKMTFKTKYLPQLRTEAIENAVKSVHQDLIRHLRRTNG